MSILFSKIILIAGLTFLSSHALVAQTIVPIPFGDMNNWHERVVKESIIIGGEYKKLFEISKNPPTSNNTPFVNKSSNWATSSVMAHVKGIYKGSVTVYPEKRDSCGFSARLESKLEIVKILGLINITALATGSIFLGEMLEPIKNLKNPLSKLVQGIPFTKSPSFLQFDYKFLAGNSEDSIDNSNISKNGIFDKNCGEVNLLLQYRWEDKNGNIYAKRVGTAWKRYTKDALEWINCERVEIIYGDITSHKFFESYMGLICEEPIYGRNSKGEVVPVKEIDWASSCEKPTHIVLTFSSGCGRVDVGTPGAKMWIDNVALGYNDR